MLKIGAHVSISGGFHKSINREKEIGGNCGQIFSHSPRSWNFSIPNEEESKLFREKYNEDIKPIVIHESYLPNLATPKEELHKKSMDAMRKEIKTADSLNIKYINIHPGTHTGFGEDNGIKKIIRSLNKLYEELNPSVEILLENTAGKGTTIGYTFEQLKRIMDGTKIETGVTIDTCHAFSAGYDLKSKDGLDEVLKKFDEILGLENLRIIHLNDSKYDLGSERDRHEHIGEGKIGKEAMKRIINHSLIKDKPFILETPEENGKGHKDNIKVVKKLREN